MLPLLAIGGKPRVEDADDTGVLTPRNAADDPLPLDRVARHRMVVLLYNMQKAGVPKYRLDEIKELWNAIGSRGPLDPATVLCRDLLAVVFLSLKDDPPPPAEAPGHLDELFPDLFPEQEPRGVVYSVCEWLRTISLVSKGWRDAVENGLIKEMLLGLLEMQKMSGDMETTGSTTVYAHFVAECWRNQGMLIMQEAVGIKISQRVLSYVCDMAVGQGSNGVFAELCRPNGILIRIDEDSTRAYDLIATNMWHPEPPPVFHEAVAAKATQPRPEGGRGYTSWPPQAGEMWLNNNDVQGSSYSFWEEAQELRDEVHRLEQQAVRLIQRYYTYKNMPLPPGL